MKFINTTRTGILLELNATDCLMLADAIAYAQRYGVPSDAFHLETMGALFNAGAVAAALDTLSDGAARGDRALAETRRVWAPLDSGNVAHTRIVTPPTAAD